MKSLKKNINVASAGLMLHRMLGWNPRSFQGTSAGTRSLGTVFVAAMARSDSHPPALDIGPQVGGRKEMVIPDRADVKWNLTGGFMLHAMQMTRGNVS